MFRLVCYDITISIIAMLYDTHFFVWRVDKERWRFYGIDTGDIQLTLRDAWIFQVNSVNAECPFCRLLSLQMQAAPKTASLTRTHTEIYLIQILRNFIEKCIICNINFYMFRSHIIPSNNNNLYMLVGLWPKGIM